MPRKCEWTEDQESLLEQLRAQRVSIAEIARRLNKGEATVCIRLKNMNLPKYRREGAWTPEERHELARFWAEGVLVKNIAYLMGKTESQIRNERRRLKLPNRTNQYDSAQGHTIQVRFNKEFLRDMDNRAKQLGVSRSTYVRECVFAAVKSDLLSKAK